MFKVDKRYLGNLEQVCFVRESELTEGKGRGKRILDVNNGALRFTVLKDNCLDITDLAHKGTNYSFISKTGLTNGVSRGYTDLVENFGGGFLYTCGLDAAGVVEGKRTHGSIHWTPSERVEISVTAENIIIKGVMRDSNLFGQDIVLERTIQTKPFSNEITLTDNLINCGYENFEYRLLYHVNYGYPFLDENVVIEADISETEPITDWAGKFMADSLKSEKPIDNQFEKCYYNKTNSGRVKLVNKVSGLEAQLEYDNKALPELVVWKSMTSGDYALGIEPSTTKFLDRATKKTVKAGETQTFPFKFTFK